MLRLRCNTINVALNKKKNTRIIQSDVSWWNVSFDNTPDSVLDQYVVLSKTILLKNLEAKKKHKNNTKKR